MRKFIAMLLAMLLAATLPLMAGAEGALLNGNETQIGDTPTGDPANPGNYEVVTCPEQGFSTLTGHGLDWGFQELGVYIDLGQDDDSPWVMIARADAPGSQFDIQGYFDNAFTPQMQDNFGSDLIEVGQVQPYSVAGVDMVGAMYTYRVNGRDRLCYVLFALREDGFVRYEARCYADDSSDCVAVLCAAVYYYQPDPDYYAGGGVEPQSEPEPAPQDTSDIGDRKVLSCPELGFTTAVNPAFSSVYDEMDGLYVSLSGESKIPYVLVYRTGDIIGEPAEFIKEQWTPRMQEQYGDDLMGYVEYEYYDVGGKQLPAAKYTYRLNGYVIDSLRILEVTPQGTVSYTAKFVNGEGDDTLAALDDIVRFMQQNAN